MYRPYEAAENIHTSTDKEHNNIRHDNRLDR